MRGTLQNQSLQVEGVIANYESAIRRNDTKTLKTLREVNKDLTKHFDQSDKTVAANI